MIGAGGVLQSVQELAPAKLADPLLHMSQTVAPFSPEKYPALHCKHTPDVDAPGGLGTALVAAAVLEGVLLLTRRLSLSLPQ